MLLIIIEYNDDINVAIKNNKNKMKEKQTKNNENTSAKKFRQLKSELLFYVLEINI